MSIECCHEGCDCTPGPNDRYQWKCNGCGTYSQPVRYGEALEVGTPAEGYVDGCWVRTGVLCPDCNPVHEKATA